MSLLDLIQGTIIIIKGAYTIAVVINESEDLHHELRQTANRVSIVLRIVEEVIDQFENLAHRVTVDGERFLASSTNSVKSIVTDIEDVLKKVQKERGFVKRLLMKKDEYQRRLIESTNQLSSVCQMIQGAIPGLALIQISHREIPNLRKQFHHLPDKDLTIFDFLITRDTSDKILAIATEHFDSRICSCYLQVSHKQFLISYHLRTWSALKPTPIILEKRVKKFREQWHNGSTPNLTGSNSSLSSVASTHSVPPTTDAATNITHYQLDFSQFFMSNNDVCGTALTQSMIYIATKCEITIFSLNRQEILAQYGKEGTGHNTFQHICYIYIPPNDETSLYVVDRGQNVVHQYKIDNSGLRFEYVRRYVVISNNYQHYNLQSCAIYNNNLYVSDSGNNCLHIFPLNGERQSFYLSDKSMTPFSPGPICAHGKYLYVANCSAENPSILVLNEECEPVDWFRNKSLRQILAIDIEPNINELFILTTTVTNDENGELKKRPLIVSMDLLIRSENS